MGTNKKRLDILLVDRGLAESREKARASIMSGEVFVDGLRTDKAGTAVSAEAAIEVRSKKSKFVSRGGYKLEKALGTFNIDPSGLTVLDAGASTGGFTDCLLQRGAEKVFAVDVGYGQLAWSLRKNERVICLERTNVRYLSPDMLGELVDMAVMDLSFISLKLVLPAVHASLREGGCVVCLIKPQFEAGRDKVGKKGVVRDAKTHIEVLQDLSESFVNLDFSLLGLSFSPIKGPEGNIEYLGYLKKGTAHRADVDIPALVRMSHESLNALEQPDKLSL